MYINTHINNKYTHTYIYIYPYTQTPLPQIKNHINTPQLITSNHRNYGVDIDFSFKTALKVAYIHIIVFLCALSNLLKSKK